MKNHVSFIIILYTVSITYGLLNIINDISFVTFDILCAMFGEQNEKCVQFVCVFS